jgi:predicted phage tail protein
VWISGDSEMLVNVRLVGEMADCFGYHHQFDVQSMAEIISALRVNFKEFHKFLVSSAYAGTNYELVSDLSPGLTFDSTPCVVLAPIIAGAGATGKIIAGVVLIGISVFAPFSIGLLGAGIVTSGQIGAALLLSGVSEALNDNKSPTRKTGTAIGTIGTITDGDVIPIAYGRVFISGKVISAGSTISRR